MTTMPKRILRSRRRRLPPGAIYVGRPTKYGNRFTHLDGRTAAPEKVGTAAEAVERFREECGPSGRYEIADADIKALAGHDLACWCKPGEPCHADVLLQWANPEEHEGVLDFGQPA